MKHKGLYNWIFQCGGCMTFSDKCDTSTTTPCGAHISEEPLVSNIIIIIFHPENGSKRLLHVVWYICTELHAITFQKTVVLMSYYIYVFKKFEIATG
jgi:hypothetical protein